MTESQAIFPEANVDRIDHHCDMNLIKHVVSGLCTSLLLSLNCDSAAAVVFASQDHPDWKQVTGNPQVAVLNTLGCVPCNFAEV